MKWILISLAVISALLLQQFQCNRCDYICSESVNFKIVDSKTGADLFFGPQALYEADSVWTAAAPASSNAWNRAWLMRYDSMFSLIPEYTGGKSYPSDTLFFKNNKDIDTVHIVFNPKATSCCKPYFYIKAIYFNGVSATNKDGYWIFTKY